MNSYEMVKYKTSSGEQTIYLRDAWLGHRGAVDNTIVGVAVDERGREAFGEHRSQRIVRMSAITNRVPLRLDPEQGLVEVAGGTS